MGPVTALSSTLPVKAGLVADHTHANKRLNPSMDMNVNDFGTSANLSIKCLSPAAASFSGCKRKRSDGISINENLLNDVEQKPCSGKRSRTSQETYKRLACPFFKRAPAQNQDCVKAAYQTWAHVKQHLRRKHFVEVASLHSRHTTPRDRKRLGIRETECVAIGRLGLTIFGEEELKVMEELTRPRKLSDCERWEKAWRVMFPHVEPPASPFAQDPRTSLLEHVIQTISDRPRSFDSGLVNAKLVQSEDISEVIIGRLIDFLRGTVSAATPIHYYAEGSEGKVDSLLGSGEMKLVRGSECEAISNGSLTEQDITSSAPTPIRATPDDGMGTTMDLNMPEWNYSNDESLDELLRSLQEEHVDESCELRGSV